MAPPGMGAPLNRLSLPRDPSPSGCYPFRVSVGLLDYTVPISFCKDIFSSSGPPGFPGKKRDASTRSDGYALRGYSRFAFRSSCTIMVMASTWVSVRPSTLTVRLPWAPSR